MRTKRQSELTGVEKLKEVETAGTSKGKRKGNTFDKIDMKAFLLSIQVPHHVSMNCDNFCNVTDLTD